MQLSPASRGEPEEIDSNLGYEYIETDGGSAAIPKNKLGGQEISIFLVVAPDRRCL